MLASVKKRKHGISVKYWDTLRKPNNKIDVLTIPVQVKETEVYSDPLLSLQDKNIIATAVLAMQDAIIHTVVNEMAERRWRISHISHTGSHYMVRDNDLLRISNHDLPNFPQSRPGKRKIEIVIDGIETPTSLIDRILDAIEKDRA